MNRVDPDAELSEIHCGSFGHTSNRPFGCGVGDLVGVGAVGGDGGDVDDTAVAGCLHQPRDGVHAEKDSELVDPVMGVEVLRTGVLDVAFRFVDTRIVDQCRHLAVPVVGAVDDVLPGLFVGDVMWDVVTSWTQFVGKSTAALGAAAGDGDRTAVLAQCPDDGGADAAAAAGA